jgi:PD-(D/E)XK nuclease superfamily protein
MDDQVKITGKNLGYIELKKYCPQCFFYLLRFGFKPPFSFFGGAVFKWLEDMERAAVHHKLKHNSCLPEEFEPFCDLQAPIDFPRHWSKYGYMHKSGVFVYGVPDDIFVQENGKLCVIDYKTAGHKGTDDEFYCQYRVQVISYANIAELGLDLGQVDRGGLLYWAAEVDKFDPSKHYKAGRISPAFKVATLEIDIDYNILDPLFKEVKDVWNSKVPPNGAAGCDNCKKLARLFAIQAEIDAYDARILYQYRAFPDMTSGVINRRYERDCLLREAIADLRGNTLLFAQDETDEPIWDFSNTK